MKRLDIVNALGSAYKCYAIGSHKGECISPYIVLKYDNQLTSVNNSQCGWQVVHIFCYVPKTNILKLDDMIENVKQILKNILEFTGDITPEQIDEEKNAYFRRMKYRIPKEVI